MTELGMINFLREFVGLQPLRHLIFQDVADLCDREIERTSGDREIERTSGVTLRMKGATSSLRE